MDIKQLLGFLGNRENSPSSRAHAIVSYCGYLTNIQIVAWGRDVLESVQGDDKDQSISALRKLVQAREITLGIKT